MNYLFTIPINTYELIQNYDSIKESSFLEAHKNLMDGLIVDSGTYRRQGVGIVKGSKVAHLAPPHQNVPFLMKDLFAYLKSDEIELIKSCVLHYEMEFIHPFLDGNGRMGRLWQTLILMTKYPVFEYIPFETLISKDQDKYYNTLAECDKTGRSTLFIEYMLDVINKSLSELLHFNGRNWNTEQRLNYFIYLDIKAFTRKTYMDIFKDISSSTASRDLKKGIALNIFRKEGDKNKTTYKIIGHNTI